MRMVDAVKVERVRGLDVHVVTLDVPTYVDGLSVVAHKLMELINAEVLLQAVGMEDRVFVTARSRAGSGRRAASCSQSVGGGGHAQAASAVVRERTPEEVIRTAPRLPWPSTNLGVPTAGEIMSRPVRFIDADTPVTDALVTAQRYGHSGICVQGGRRRGRHRRPPRPGQGHPARTGPCAGEGRHDPQHLLRPGRRPRSTSCAASWWRATSAACRW